MIFPLRSEFIPMNIGTPLLKNKMNQKFSNRLVHESSPYLLQHAHNPVDWFP